MPATPPSSSRRWSGSAGSPNRSELRLAAGLAPMARMSRMIPPTPVAAPWKGSTNDGWLWDSILNTAATPSPRSTTPAFSPGPSSTRSPWLGSRGRYQHDGGGPPGGAGEGVHRVLGVGHGPDDVAGRDGHVGDVGQRAV